MFTYDPQDFKIICITDRKSCSGDFLKKTEEIAGAGVSAVILREKDMSAEEYERLAGDVMNICKKAGVGFAAHTFIKSAANAGFQYIHLPLPMLKEAILKDFKFSEFFDGFGVSVHSAAEALEAAELGASYVTAGHVFVTDCKKGLEPRGIPFLRRIAELLDIPAYAIGGINPDNIAEVKAAGAAGACIMSGFMKAADVKKFVQELRAGL